MDLPWLVPLALGSCFGCYMGLGTHTPGSSVWHNPSGISDTLSSSSCTFEQPQQLNHRVSPAFPSWHCADLQVFTDVSHFARDFHARTCIFITNLVRTLLCCWNTAAVLIPLERHRVPPSGPMVLREELNHVHDVHPSGFCGAATVGGVCVSVGVSIQLLYNWTAWLNTHGNTPAELMPSTSQAPL